jgi:glutathione S-transferase
VTWNAIVQGLLGEEYNINEKYPNFVAWNARITARPAVAKVMNDKAEVAHH